MNQRAAAASTAKERAGLSTASCSGSGIRLSAVSGCAWDESSNSVELLRANHVQLAFSRGSQFQPHSTRLACRPFLIRAGAGRLAFAPYCGWLVCAGMSRADLACPC